MPLIVAGTFIVTFLIVCLGYVLLLRRTVAPDDALPRLSEGRRRSSRAGGSPEFVIESDDDGKRLALREQALRTVQWLDHHIRADRSKGNTLPPRVHRTPGLGVMVLVIGATIVVVVVTFLAVVAAFNQLFAWFFAPVVDRALSLLLPVLLIPEGPPVLAALILVFGLRLSRRFRRPERFRAGLIAIASALATFWPLQYVAGSIEVPFWEYTVVLRGIAAFISVCLFTGGVESMRRARNTPKDDSWEFLN